jgi:predicted ABC-type transport system involved in lysophospholipase L1 biosynthesis ATPase subunit
VVIDTLAASEGRTVIAASHDRALVERLGREARLEHGRLEARA